MPTTSILMPTWNGASFIREQVASILGQSDPDFELLVMDDGSSDDTVAIIEELVGTDARLRLLPSSGNRGQRRRLVELLSQALGTFIAIADQDDIWASDRNERLLAGIGSLPLAFGRSDIIDGAGGEQGRSLLEAFRIDAKTQGRLRSLFYPLVSAHAALIRRDWLDVGAFYGSRPFDWLIALEAQFSSGLVYIDDAIVYHRIHGNNQSNGSVAREKANRRFSRSRLRLSTGFVASDRILFYQTVEFLSRSVVLKPDVRRVMSNVVEACFYAWYYHLDYTLNRGRKLERDLHVLLAPFAESDDDLAMFDKTIRSLTRSQYGPTNLVESYRRYTDWYW
ncbi:glycosyltransferase [Sphingomonas bacterium]|uniref:glycosyltransferase n=1 Tax=Sphingomonas bacterium TaxID=1895847 RepID=UPI0015772C9B|nr:glycosyltransferase [Sphingomonas bacterium]